MIRLLWSTLCLFAAAAAVASPSKALLTRNVEILSAQSNTVTVQAEIDCGERVAGIVVNEVKSTVGVSLVVERPEIVCGNAPKVETFTFPFFSTAKRSFVSLTSADDETRLTLQEHRVATGAFGVEFSWDNTNCRTPLGIFIAPESVGKVVTSAAFKAVSKSRSQTCTSDQRSMTLKSLRPEAANWRQLRKPGKISELYSLRLVTPTSLKINPKGELEAAWTKTCRDTFIGFLYSGQENRSIGILTAYTPNNQCAHSGRTVAKNKVSGLAIKSNSKITPITQQESESINQFGSHLQMTSTKKIEFTRTSRQMYAVNRDTCFNTIGTVIGNDSLGNLAVASLNKSSDGICKSSHGITRGSLPLVVKNGLIPKIFPLRIAGSFAH
jgi:hypothetical protein